MKKINTVAEFVTRALKFAQKTPEELKQYLGNYAKYLTALALNKKFNFNILDFYDFYYDTPNQVYKFFQKYLETHNSVVEKFKEIDMQETVSLNELNHRFIELLGRNISQNYYLIGDEDLIDLYFREGKELEEPIEFSFKSVEDAAKYVCVLEGSRNQKLFPDIVSGPRGSYKSEGISIFFDSNAQAALKSLLDQGYNIEPDTRGGQSFKIVEDKHTIDNIVKKYKLTLFDKSTYSGDISDYIDRHTKIDSKTGVHTVHNSVKDLLKYGHANRRDNYQNKYNNQDYWENDMNIYEQLNKINDNESLSEKYNVKNAKELKKLKESISSIKIPAPWNKYLEVDDYTPEEGEYAVGDKIGEYILVAYLAPKSAYEDKFDGWPVLFKDSTNNYVVGETSHDRVYPWDIDDYALTESSNGKQDVRHEAQRIHDELIKKGYTNEEIKSIFSILHTAAINNFEPARPKLKAAFPDLDI